MFEYSFKAAGDYGFRVTASVFDRESLNYLNKFNIPFIKVAADKKWWSLVPHCSPTVPLILSCKFDEDMDIMAEPDVWTLACVADYPAAVSEYEEEFSPAHLSQGISDHCIGTHLYAKYKPIIWEKHYCIEHGKTDDKFGDAFCVTIPELKAALNGRQ
jgi:sialic acid synthase SpsE